MKQNLERLVEVSGWGAEDDSIKNCYLTYFFPCKLLLRNLFNRRQLRSHDEGWWGGKGIYFSLD